MPEQDEEVLISVKEGADIAAVAERLRKAAVRVESVLEDARVITARMPSSQIPAVGALEGVAAAEPSREVHIAPPESEIQ
jgi:hypothetical protein